MENDKTNKNNPFSKLVGIKEERKLEAQRQNKSVWSGLGLFGMVGWSIVVPTLLGAALGKWLDNIFEQSFSWTLSLLLAGLMFGCIVAWNWVQKEDIEIHKKSDDGLE